MNRTLHLLSRKRQDLVDISHQVFGAIPDEYLRDPSNPVVVSVRGTFEGGKKVIPDTAIEYLYGISPNDRERLTRIAPYVNQATPRLPASFEGKRNYDERWLGARNDMPLEINFINAAWHSGYRTLDENFHDYTTLDDQEYQIASAFLDLQRQAGGISFVHNSHILAQRQAWIDIWIEKSASMRSIVGDYPSLFKKSPKSLKEQYNAVATESDYDWTRYIRLDIRHNTLLGDPRFVNALKPLHDSGMHHRYERKKHGSKNKPQR
ncbi:MAG: hypothetical protein H6867_01865 [Rhodospirillales bacterium]|nr:hypothetical protein [Rhodospirillales bacterium]MCB9997264.1 hypothetical protein [Rhodospirillales bacterium]